MMTTSWIINGKRVPDCPTEKELKRLSVDELVELAKIKRKKDKPFKAALISHILDRDGIHVE